MAASRRRTRTPHSVHPTARRKAALQPPSDELSSDSGSDVDVDEVRRARTDFYGKTWEEQEMRSTAKLENEAATRPPPRTTRSSRVQDFRDGSEKAEKDHHETPLRRRRKKRRSSEGDDGNVYKSVYEDTKVHSTHRLDQDRTRAAAGKNRISSAPVPERVRILRTLGLETPQRSKSQSIRRAGSELRPRRNVKTGDAPAGEVQGKDANAPKTTLRRCVL